MNITETAKELRNEYQRKWKSRNRDKINQYQREWRAKNKDKCKQYNQRYWERKAEQLEKERGSNE